MDNKDDYSLTRAVVRLLQLPAIILSIPQSEHGHLGVFKQRMRTALAGEQVEPNGLVEKPSKPFDDARFAAARRLIQAKEPSRAIKALLRQPLADINSPIIQAKLQSLHPPRKPGVELPSLIDEKNPPEPFIITPKDVKQMIAKFPRKSGAGPSGWTFEMIRDACANDETNTTMFAKLFTRMANGDIPEQLSPYLLAALLLPAGKENNGVRPITIGEPFYRAVCSRVVSVVGPAMVKWFWPIQAGVAIKAGAEMQIHRVQALAEKGDSSVKFDFINAFNTLLRLVIFLVVRSLPEMDPAKRLIEWAYRQPSLLLAMSNGQVAMQIWSEEGSRQGCPLGSLLFCCGIHPTLLRIQSAHPEVTITAFIDDLNASSKLKLLPPVCTDVKQDFAEIGLQLSMEKCEALVNGVAEDSKEQEWFGEQRIKQGSTAVKYLGGAIGNNPAARSAILQATVNKHRPLFAALADPRLSAQESTYLARQCVNHKLSYLIAVSPPTISSPIAQEFDLQLRQALSKRLNIELNGKALEQAQLPVAMAGLGLRSAQWLAPIAFLSSHARAAKAMKSVSISGTPTMQALTDSLAAVKQMVSPPTAHDLPADVSTFYSHFASHPAAQLQHVLTAEAELRIFEQMVKQANSTYDRARLKAASADKASLWITAAPTSPETRLDDSSFQLAVRHLLGLRPADILPLRCPFCNHANGDLQTNPWHPLSCPRLAGTASTSRHDTGVQTIAGWISKLGGYVKTERPLKLMTKNGEIEIIPDIDAQLDDQRYLIDYSQVDVTCPTHVDKGATVPLAVAAEIERKKHAIYRELAEQIRPKPIVVPFVVESYGGLGVEATDFVKKLITKAATMASVWQPSEFVHSIFWSIACATQRWNSRIMRDAICGTNSTARQQAYGRKHSMEVDDEGSSSSSSTHPHSAAPSAAPTTTQQADKKEAKEQSCEPIAPRIRQRVRTEVKRGKLAGTRARAAHKKRSERKQREEGLKCKRQGKSNSQMPTATTTEAKANSEQRQQAEEDKLRDEALQAERARFTRLAAEKRNQQSQSAKSATTSASRASAAPSAQPTRTAELSQSGRNRVQERLEELRMLRQEEEQQSEERERLQKTIGPAVQRRLGQLSYLELCRKLNPSCRLKDNANKDEVRKMLRKTMALYHPDRNRSLQPRQQVEAEETFRVLQTAYQELTS